MSDQILRDIMRVCNYLKARLEEDVETAAEQGRYRYKEKYINCGRVLGLQEAVDELEGKIIQPYGYLLDDYMNEEEA